MGHRRISRAHCSTEESVDPVLCWATIKASGGYKKAEEVQGTNKQRHLIELVAPAPFRMEIENPGEYDEGSRQ